MFGLPPSSEVNTQLPKKAVVEKFDLKGKGRTSFDSSIHRMVITNEISPRTVNVSEGDIKGIFVLRVELHGESYDPGAISALYKAIDQNMIMILTCGPRCRPVIFHGRLIEGDWRLIDEMILELKGLDLDDIWRNLVLDTGGFTLEGDNDLDAQLRLEDERETLRREISRLEKQMMSEKQNPKKRELFERIRTLKQQMP